MKISRISGAVALSLVMAATPAAFAKGGNGHGKQGQKALKQQRKSGRQSGRSMFGRYDTNSDGVLERSEWPYDASVFDMADVNRDGVLTQSEAQAAKDRALNDQGQFDRVFDRADTNRDGVISRNEWPRDLQLFDRLDTNGDGVLTRDELNRAREQYRSGQRYGGDQQMRFRGMDRNGDGIITRDEWRGNDRSFQNHDRNGDGILSGDEVRPGGHDE